MINLVNITIDKYRCLAWYRVKSARDVQSEVNRFGDAVSHFHLKILIRTCDRERSDQDHKMPVVKGGVW